MQAPPEARDIDGGDQVKPAAACVGDHRLHYAARTPRGHARDGLIIGRHDLPAPALGHLAEPDELVLCGLFAGADAGIDGRAAGSVVLHFSGSLGSVQVRERTVNAVWPSSPGRVPLAGWFLVAARVQGLWGFSDGARIPLSGRPDFSPVRGWPAPFRQRQARVAVLPRPKGHRTNLHPGSVKSVEGRQSVSLCTLCSLPT